MSTVGLAGCADPEDGGGGTPGESPIGGETPMGDETPTDTPEDDS